MSPLESDDHPDLMLERKEAVEGFRRAWASMEPRERIVLHLRFGMGEEPPLTLREIGKRIGVSGSRVRQIQSKALRKLRHPTRGKYLRLFWETE